MRELNEFENKNIKVLTSKSISLTLIEPTETGLKKSIMDATGSVRNYFKSNHLHDYDLQSQGPHAKVILECLIYTEFTANNSRVSLYRPNTKNGDPRIWFSGLTKYAEPNDILALIIFDSTVHLINLTKISIDNVLASNIINPIKELVEQINDQENLITNELLDKLKKIAKSPIPSMLDADTSVGRTLETALGIDINSSKQPDYKGIELKSFRSKKGNRKTLFAQVPNWELSKFKSSAEILKAFGYSREEDFKLYCTVSSKAINSQGLSMYINGDDNHLIETSDNHKIKDFVIWELKKLHHRLLEKHKETFWVSADTVTIGGIDHFHYKEVEHTKKPITSQFDILIEQGVITLDHLIKKNSKGRVVEKGPLFKIKPNSLNLLFPPSERYLLM
jgi:hypothetical protein